MAYTEEICQSLIQVLDHTAGLSVHQLAGHVANIEFWMDEVRHVVAVLDGYDARFEKLRFTQSVYEQRHPHVVHDPVGWSKKKGTDAPLKANSRDLDRKQLRHRLLEATDRLLDRALKENLIDLSRSDDLRERVTGDPNIRTLSEDYKPQRKPSIAENAQ